MISKNQSNVRTADFGPQKRPNFTHARIPPFLMSRAEPSEFHCSTPQPLRPLRESVASIRASWPGGRGPAAKRVSPLRIGTSVSLFTRHHTTLAPMANAHAVVLERFKEPLQLREYPIPTRLEPGAALVRTEMAGICGTDVHL